jgi:hypothetical protein
MTIAQVAQVFAKIDEMAKEIAPDYPGIKTCDSTEQLWAIRSSYEGLHMANNDLHYILEDLMSKLNMSREDMTNYCARLINEKDRKEYAIRYDQC